MTLTMAKSYSEGIDFDIIGSLSLKKIPENNFLSCREAILQALELNSSTHSSNNSVQNDLPKLAWRTCSSPKTSMEALFGVLNHDSSPVSVNPLCYNQKHYLMCSQKVSQNYLRGTPVTPDLGHIWLLISEGGLTYKRLLKFRDSKTTHKIL